MHLCVMCVCYQVIVVWAWTEILNTRVRIRLRFSFLKYGWRTVRLKPHEYNNTVQLFDARRINIMVQFILELSATTLNKPYHISCVMIIIKK